MRFRPKSIKVILFSIGLFVSLISFHVAMAQQGAPVLPIVEAVQTGQVQVTIQGLADDSRFVEPMLRIDLVNMTTQDVIVEIPRGQLLISSNTNYADVINLRKESIPLQAQQQSPPIGLFTYSLSYTKSFPNKDIAYSLGTVSSNEGLFGLFDEITEQRVESDIASQFAVWMDYHKLELKDLEVALNTDLSAYARQIEALRTPFDWGKLIIRALTTITIIVGALILVVVIVGIWKVYHHDNSFLGERPVFQPGVGKLRLRAKSRVLTFSTSQPYKVGGMAEIWRALDLHSNEFIVKFPRPDRPNVSEAEITHRFDKEILSQKKLHHRNISEIIETGKCHHPSNRRQTRYLVQPFIHGCTLEELIQLYSARLPEEIVFEILAQILDALDYVHEQGVVHRDLTLKNIMVDVTGQVYLIDFGNATQVASTDTRSLGFNSFGTPPFYAPELGHNIADKRSDFYSLAIILYALLVGKKPMQALEPAKVKSSLMALSVSDRVQNTIIKCLNEDMEQRCQNVQEFRQSLGLTKALPRQFLAEIVSGGIFHPETQPVSGS